LVVSNWRFIQFPSGLSKLGLALGLLLCSTPAGADEAAAAAAQSLFEQGRDLLRAGQYAEACPLLAESQRLDAATGTLLALAMCHEAEGKLASAWAAFSGVVTMARRDGQQEREQLARQRSAAIKPRLSMLELTVPAHSSALSGFQLRRNGLLLGKDSWNLPIPVDGGRYEIIASAPRALPWKTQIEVGTEADIVVLNVPELQPAPATTDGRALPPTAAVVTGDSNAGQWTPKRTASDEQRDSPDFSGWQWTGVAAMGLGLASFATSGYFLFEALDRFAEAEPDCNASGCVEPGFSKQQEGRRLGNQATGLAVGGAVLGATGAAMFYWGGNDDEARSEMTLRIGSEEFGVHFQRRF
jgi:hypothetical protein